MKNYIWPFKGKRRFQKWGCHISYAVIILNPLILTLDKKKKLLVRDFLGPLLATQIFFRARARRRVIIYKDKGRNTRILWTPPALTEGLRTIKF